uniref:SUMO-interacting motif-containing protein 1 n=1 Tax=Oxyeleotris lineolata TaxID=308080 RepID=A0A977P1Q1_9TELE|nr:SUMO-interacting motif-containing protein 1 [Oxyeleotris lineolata]
MDAVITLSSDSDGESEVEIVGSYSNKNELLPLSSVRVEVNALNIKMPQHYSDLTDSSLTSTELNIFSRLDPPPPAVVDLTEEDLKDGADKEDSLPPDQCQKDETVTDPHQQSLKADFKSHEKSSRNSRKVVETTQVHNGLKPERRLLRSQKRLITKLYCHRMSSVVLKRLTFLEKHLKELSTSKYTVCLPETGKTMTLRLKQKDSSSITDCTGDLLNTTTLEGLKAPMETSQGQEEEEEAITLLGEAPLPPCSQADRSDLEHQISLPASTQNSDNLNLSLAIPSPAYASSSSDKAQSFLPKELRSLSPSLPVGTSTVQPETNESRNSSPAQASTFQCEDINSLPCTSPESKSIRLTKLDPLSDEVKFDEASMCCSLPPESSPAVSSVIDLDKQPFTYEEDFGGDSPVSFSWEESREEEEVRYELDTSAIQEDKHYVCPAALRKLVHGRAIVLIDDEERFRNPQMLCRQSLSLVYSTIDENYPEGTLQLLSDLLQPGYYPPKDITSHLLRSILLDQQSPNHICVQAFNLLMRTQRHHIVDRWSVPWDWELLSFVMEKQEHRCEVVRMLLEYVVQTLEDDFETKQATSAHYQSIAKVLLSFDQQFPHIRDICKWLFSAIMKSTDHNEIRDAQERDEHTRVVSIFQRMLSLALEVDCSPAICSAKLSQELFHMLISNVPLRAQRMLLLESLQSKLLRCKLLEHLLDYACPVKTSLPMSLSLLLHFLKNCTLSSDPIDGNEKWQRWEELVHHLWMLLLSYSNAMKGYLCSSKTEQRDRVGSLVYKPDDMVSKSAVREAVEAFLSRSQDDLGEALPLHVEESLTYLQDHLLDVCQC